MAAGTGAPSQVLGMVSQAVSSPTVTRCQAGRASAALTFLLELCPTDPGTPTGTTVRSGGAEELQWSPFWTVAKHLQRLLGGGLGIPHYVDWFKLQPLLIVFDTKDVIKTVSTKTIIIPGGDGDQHKTETVDRLTGLNQVETKTVSVLC